jgi:hypothetical protein
MPHRYPFLMIDRVVDVVANEGCVGIKNVSINEPFFQGHFPGHPDHVSVSFREDLNKKKIKTACGINSPSIFFILIN